MFILDQFWYGNISPGQTQYHTGKEYEKHYKIMERCENVMKPELSETGKKALDEFTQATFDIGCLSDSDNFIDGFRIGAMLILDVLSLPNGPR